VPCARDVGRPTACRAHAVDRRDGTVGAVASLESFQIDWFSEPVNAEQQLRSVMLRALTEAGLVRRIEPAGSSARFEVRVGDNHHVVCRSCGDIADVDCATGAAPCLEASDTHGYAIDEAEVTYWGTCPACRQNTPKSTQ
jgi:hypothetical protein